MSETDHSPEKHSVNPKLVDVRKAMFLVISGTGKPGGQEFQKKLSALYDLQSTLQMYEALRGRTLAVGPVEYFWQRDEDLVRWSLMMRLGSPVSDDELDRARADLVSKGRGAYLNQVEVRMETEGLCVEAEHLGAWGPISDTLDVCLKYAQLLGLKPRGGHREIYVSKHSSTPRQKRVTRLRVPVERPS